MSKYIKLNAAKTELESALFNVKPNPVRRHPDEKLPEFNWYPVIEIKPALPDRELYRHERSSWKVTPDSLKVEITYEATLVPLEQRQTILAERVNTHRNHLLSQGLTFDGYNIDSREETYKRVMGIMIKAISNSNYTTPWITDDNEEITLANSDIIRLGDAFAQFEGEHVFYARHLKNQILQSVTPETIDIKVGWPSNEFGVV